MFVRLFGKPLTALRFFHGVCPIDIFLDSSGDLLLPFFLELFWRLMYELMRQRECLDGREPDSSYIGEEGPRFRGINDFSFLFSLLYSNNSRN